MLHPQFFSMFSSYTEFVRTITCKVSEAVEEIVPDSEGCRIERLEFRGENTDSIVSEYSFEDYCVRIEQNPSCVRMSSKGRETALRRKFYMGVSRSGEFPLARKIPIPGFHISFIFHHVPLKLDTILLVWETQLLPLLQVRESISHRAAARRLFGKLAVGHQTEQKHIHVESSTMEDDDGIGSTVTEGTLNVPFLEDEEKIFDFSEN